MISITFVLDFVVLQHLNGDAMQFEFQQNCKYTFFQSHLVYCNRSSEDVLSAYVYLYIYCGLKQIWHIYGWVCVCAVCALALIIICHGIL